MPDSKDKSSYPKEEKDELIAPAHRGLIILGYILAIFGGGLLGLIIGIYLYTRENPKDKKNGLYIIIISAVFTVIAILILISIIPLIIYRSYFSTPLNVSEDVNFVRTNVNLFFIMITS